MRDEAVIAEVVDRLAVASQDKYSTQTRKLMAAAAHDALGWALGQDGEHSTLGNLVKL